MKPLGDRCRVQAIAGLALGYGLTGILATTKRLLPPLGRFLAACCPRRESFPFVSAEPEFPVV
jgi:hypothetical protein